MTLFNNEFLNSDLITFNSSSYYCNEKKPVSYISCINHNFIFNIFLESSNTHKNNRPMSHIAHLQMFSFYNFSKFSPWRRAQPLLCTNMNPLNQEMLCAKFGWFCKRRFIKVVNMVLFFCNYLPLRKGCSPSFKQTRICEKV